jgi:hypothetical protein
MSNVRPQSMVPWQLRDRVTLAYGTAVVAGMLLVVVPLLAYLGYRGIFGALAEVKLFVVCALGTAAAGALFVGPGSRTAGLISGLVGGACGAAAFLYAAALAPQAHEAWAPKGWLLLVFGVGASAAFAVFWLFERAKGRATSGHTAV